MNKLTFQGHERDSVIVWSADCPVIYSSNVSSSPLCKRNINQEDMEINQESKQVHFRERHEPIFEYAMSVE
jgi:hypothetical protein